MNAISRGNHVCNKCQPSNVNLQRMLNSKWMWKQHKAFHQQLVHQSCIIFFIVTQDALLSRSSYSHSLKSSTTPQYQSPSPPQVVPYLSKLWDGQDVKGVNHLSSIQNRHQCHYWPNQMSVVRSLWSIFGSMYGQVETVTSKWDTWYANDNTCVSTNSFQDWDTHLQLSKLWNIYFQDWDTCLHSCKELGSNMWSSVEISGYTWLLKISSCTAGMKESWIPWIYNHDGNWPSRTNQII
jgi:hypothetical protein